MAAADGSTAALGWVYKVTHSTVLKSSIAAATVAVLLLPEVAPMPEHYCLTTRVVATAGTGTGGTTAVSYTVIISRVQLSLLNTLRL